MIERLFKLSQNKTDARTEALAGLTTFLTMAYIIFVQPAVLSGAMFGFKTGMDFGAVTTPTPPSPFLCPALFGVFVRLPPPPAPRNVHDFLFFFSPPPPPAPPPP